MQDPLSKWLYPAGRHAALGSIKSCCRLQNVSDCGGTLSNNRIAVAWSNSFCMSHVAMRCKAFELTVQVMIVSRWHMLSGAVVTASPKGLLHVSI